MVRGLYTAASGMLTQEMRLEVATNNLANVDTTGYRPDRSVVADFDAMLISRLYDPMDMPFHPSRRIDPIPTVGRLGLGSFVTEINTDFEAQGPVDTTDRPLDLAIDGTGFFAVQTDAGVRYTRAGRFVTDLNNFIVSEDGNQLLGQNGPIQIPAGTDLQDVHVDGAGNIAVGEDPVDTLILVDVLPGAEKEGYTLVDATQGVAPVGEDSRVQQGAIELSPINVVREMVGLIEIQRTYEANQKVTNAEDESLDRLLQSVRG